jgi:hypothetical protein
MDVDRYRTMLVAVMDGVILYDSVDLRGRTDTEHKEFNSLVAEFHKELRPMRVHQVCGNNPLVVFYFQWCLAFSDRWPEKAQCYQQFYDYSLKNNYIRPWSLDKEYLVELELFYLVHELVLGHRLRKAA